MKPATSQITDTGKLPGQMIKVRRWRKVPVHNHDATYAPSFRQKLEPYDLFMTEAELDIAYNKCHPPAVMAPGDVSGFFNVYRKPLTRRERIVQRFNNYRDRVVLAWQVLRGDDIHEGYY